MNSGSENVAPSVSSSRWHRRLEVSGIVLFALLAVVLTAHVVESLVSMPTATRLAIAISATLLGYFLADLVSGVVHWAFDTWWSETTPIIGASFVKPFRDHHVDPASITRHDWIETNGNNCLGALPLLAVGCAMSTSSTASLFASALLLSLALGLVATNQFHKWAHEENPGRVVSMLQRWHVILPADHHHVHHAAPYDTHYCITTGWFNAMLADTDAFRRLETMIRSVRDARQQ